LETYIGLSHNGKLFAKKMVPTICAKRLDLEPPKNLTPSALRNCPGYQKSLATALERDEKIREKIYLEYAMLSKETEKLCNLFEIRKCDFYKNEIKWNPDFASLLGKRKLVRKIGCSKKSKVA